MAKRPRGERIGNRDMAADAESAPQNALADLLGEAVVSTVNGPPPPRPQVAARSASADRMRLLEEKRLQLEEKKKRLSELKAKRASAGTVVAAPDSLDVQVTARVEEQATARAPPVAAPSDLNFDVFGWLRRQRWKPRANNYLEKTHGKHTENTKEKREKREKLKS